MKVTPEVPSPQEAALPGDAETTETMARALEATSNYKILRRLVPRAPEPSRSATDRVGLIIDLETTGLDTSRNEVLEIVAIKFNNRITSAIDTFQGLQQPSEPIEPTITALSGFTDEMADGHHIDNMALEQFVSGARIMIALQPQDRGTTQAFANCHLGCSGKN